MKGARILVVKGDNDEALEIQKKLTDLGYIVPLTAVNGEEAVMKGKEIDPDLVLMDLNLPGTINGMAAAERIRALLDIPVIHLLTEVDEETLQDAKISEPFGYIVKAVNKRELNLVIEMALYRREMERKLKEYEMSFTERKKEPGISELTGPADMEAEATSRNKTVEMPLRPSKPVMDLGQKLLNEMFELLPAYLILLTPDYHVSYTNRFFRERFGEPDNQRCFKYLFGRDKPCENCETYQVLETMAPHEWEWLGPDGRNYYIYDFPLSNIDGSPIIMETGFDITELKQAEKGFRMASAYNRNLIEASLDPLVTIGPGGTITDVNVAIEAVTGYSREELIGTDFSDYFTDRDKARAGYQKVFQEGLVRDYALEIRRRDGFITPVLYNASIYRDDTGSVIGVIAAARDITELKEAQVELQKNWELLRVTMNSIGEGVIVADQDGKIMLINQAAADLTGYSQTEAFGELLSKVFYVMDDKTGEPIPIAAPQKTLYGSILVTRDLKEMDLTVPGGLGGQETIAYLRDIDPQVKAIVSSGYANDPIIAGYERFGFCGVVSKPYKFDEITEVLNRVIEQKRLSLKLCME